MSEQSTSGTALVFGASGISGWGITSAILRTPKQGNGSFRRVIAVNNRHMSLEDSHFPSDDRLLLGSDVDLQLPVEDIRQRLLNISQDVKRTTHMYFAAFCTSAIDNQLDMKRINTRMLVNAVQAVESLSPCLEFVTLQTGTNHYGVLFAESLGDKFGPLPLKESLPRLPPPLDESLLFYAQVDEMTELSRGKEWSWCDVRPDMVIGYLPRPNSHSIVESLGGLLAFYAFVRGEGARLRFPGTAKSWSTTFTMTGQELLGDFTVHASTSDQVKSGSAYNIAGEKVTSWRELWPALARLFKIEGVGPEDESGEKIDDVGDWIIEHIDKVRALEKAHGVKREFLLKMPWRYLDWTLQASVNREADVTLAKSTGFDVSEAPEASFVKAWSKMKLAPLLALGT